MERPMIFTSKSPVDNKPFIIEQWKRIDSTVYPDADGPSWVSTLGRVYSENINSIVLPSHNKDGYCTINVKVGNKHTSLLLHRCIMIAFYPISNYELYDVNHNDGDKDNCCVYNLSWVTRGENIKYAYMNGQRKIIKGNDHYKSNLSNEDLDLIGQLLKERKLTNREISEMIGCSEQIVSHILNGETYVDIYNKYRLYEVVSHRNMNRFSDEQKKQIQLIVENNELPHTNSKADQVRQILSRIGYVGKVDKATIITTKRLIDKYLR